MTTFVLALFLAAGPAATTTAPAKPAAGVKPAAPSNEAAELRSVLEKMQKRYDQAKDFRAKFSQTYSRAVVGRSTVSTGTLSFKKPGRMRWDYEKPEPRMFLSNGQVLWLYEPTEKQAFKQDLKSSQLPAALVEASPWLDYWLVEPAAALRYEARVKSRVPNGSAAAKALDYSFNARGRWDAAHGCSLEASWQGNALRS